LLLEKSYDKTFRKADVHIVYFTWLKLMKNTRTYSNRKKRFSSRIRGIKDGDFYL